MHHLVFATANGTIELSYAAKAFVEKAAFAIRNRLIQGEASFGLMPYRHEGHDYLGADWKDNSGNSLSLTFYIGSPTCLPDVGPEGDGYDVVICDFTDALHLIRAITISVKGNAIGEV